MPTLRCPGCKSTLRLRDDLAGKKIKCPRCEKVITVPEAEPEVLAEVEPEPEEAITSAPARKRRGEEDRPRGRQRDEEDYEDEDDAPRRKRRRRDDGDRGGRPRYKPCPRCGGDEAKRVVWTPWGSFYGPAMFTHVRCLDCDYKYNGRTGGSNLIPAIIFVSVPLIAILGLLGFIVWMILRSMQIV
jgi:predicted Zn finger-like uncharacterized protein